MSRRTWFYIGSGFGFIIPFVLNVLLRLSMYVRSTAFFLFRPGQVVLDQVRGSLDRFLPFVFVGILIIVLNAAIFGFAAYVLRKGFLVLITVLVIICYVSLPPSDAKMMRQFDAVKPDLERAVEMASQTPSIWRIGKLEIEDTEGRKYSTAEKQGLLSSEAWAQYRQIFEKTDMKDGLYRWPRTGQMRFLSHTFFGKVGPIGTLYGYVYCPAASDALQTGLEPCSEGRDEYDIIDYRYKRLASDWFLEEIYETHSLAN
jgi:hypothetical protein